MNPLSSELTAGLLLSAIPHFKQFGLPTPSAGRVLEALAATKTTAYKAKKAIEEVIPTLFSSAGRPKKVIPQVDSNLRLDIVHKVRDFLFEHPGAVSGSGKRRTYSQGFRWLTLDICENTELPIEVISKDTGVPLGTLKDWMKGGLSTTVPEKNACKARSQSTRQVESVVHAWKTWDGGFVDFCHHIQFHLRIPFSRAAVRDILATEGVRIPAKRRRDPDASARRKTFETFFPDAQWVGDGTELSVEVFGQVYKVNLELLVDVDTGTFTGASIRPTEDAEAVIEAFQDGVETAGQQPLALLLDNKPSNHCEAVKEALDDTILMRPRPFTPTDKPHIEGAFGLLKNEVPPLVISDRDPQRLAEQIAQLVVNVWGRAANHRPQRGKNGLSRDYFYRKAQPTDEEIENARAALRERARKQERARETKARRQDPIIREFLDKAFARLGLDDPDASLRIAIASWPLDAIVEGIAIFESKKARGTLPEGVDGRYLRGIIKNISYEREVMEFASQLLQGRVAAQDLMLRHLQESREKIDEEETDVDAIIKSYVSKAMDSRRKIDRVFWLLATSDILNDYPREDARVKLRLAARRIAVSSKVSKGDRDWALRFLFAKVISLD